MGKNRMADFGSQDHAASSQNNPRARFLVRRKMEPPGMLVGRFHSLQEQLCSVLRLVRMLPMSHIRKPCRVQADDRTGPPRSARLVLKDPSAGVRRGYENLGKLELRQGLLIPWYHEDKDCDYLHVPQVVAPDANAVSPSSDLGSFAVNMSTLINIKRVPVKLTDVRVRYAVIQ